MRSQQNVKRRECNWAEELIGSEEASIITTEKEGRLTYWDCADGCKYSEFRRQIQTSNKT